MTSSEDDARQAHRLLLELIDLDPNEQKERLERAAAGNPQLKQDVLELLSAAECAAGFLEQPVSPTELADLGPHRFVGARVGDYVLLSVVGSGGMGTVFRARQVEPPREVALKIMNPGLLNRRAAHRFRDEVRALGRLEHPGIARLYASGDWDAGFGRVPWYAMELVSDGRHITDYARDAGLSRDERLSLFRGACAAVHYGHLRGVIHRDLKPANILVDSSGQVRVIDLGVARLLGDQDQTVTLSLAAGAVGTIPYMSPEQFSMDGADVDTRTDVYALGVVLFELLTGNRPHALASNDLLEAARTIRESEPTRPSRYDPSLRGDLESVVMKAIARSPSDRYQSVAELSRDVERFLGHEPVVARQPGAWRRAVLFARRHRTIVTLCSVAATLLMTATAVSTTLAWQLERERDVSLRVAQFLARRFWSIDPEEIAFQLRRGLVAKVEEAGRWAVDETGNAEARAASLEGLLAGADFTSLARETLDANFLRPALREIETAFVGHPLLQADLLQVVASAQMELGLLDEAAAPQERALAIRSAELGEDDPLTLQSRAWQGQLLHLRGEYAAARDLLQRVVESQRRVSGVEDLDVLTSMSNLAKARRTVGDLDGAVALQREVCRGYLAMASAEDPRTLTAMSNLATALYARGDYQEARTIQERVFESRRRVLGDDEPETYRSMGNLAQTLHALGEHEQARELQERVVDARIRTRGLDHRETLIGMGELAQTRRALGDAEGARKLEEQVLERRRALLSEGHPHTLTAMNNLAVTLKELNDLDGAIQHFERALEVRRRVLPKDHPDTLISMVNLARTRSLRGDLEGARDLEEEAFEGSMRTLNADHPVTLVSMSNLAHTLDTLGEVERSRELAARALDGIVKKWGPKAERAQALEALLAKSSPKEPRVR